jgi:uncharacterized protein (TIGR02996 family)
VPDAEAFLQAILAVPDADGPRLVFADWLDENGDPVRAEFIRVQIALARMAEDDERRATLAARERELIGAVRDRWLREYAEGVRGSSEIEIDESFSLWLCGIGTKPGRRHATFERGMLEGVWMDAGLFRQRMDTVFRAGPVRHLCLTELRKHVVALADRPWPGRVTRFTVSHTRFRRGDLVRLLGSPNLANLRELTVADGVRIDPNDVAGLVGLRLDRLESLNLTSGEIGPDGAETLAGWPQLPRLTRLGLCYQQLGSDGVEALCAPGHLERLTQLDLALNGITAAGASAVARSEFFGALEVLDMRVNPLGDGGVARVARGPHRGRLRGLNLGGTNCGPAGIRELVRSACLGSLTELRLSSNRIGAEGAAALAEAPAVAGLQTLELANGDVGIEGVQALAASPYLSGLRSLNLAVNQLGEDGLRVLIDSTCLTSLRSLDLGQNGLGNASARALARWPGLARLKYLGLGSNQIGDAGAQALADSPYAAGVGTLDLSYNHRITERGKAAMATAGLSNVVLR